MAYFTEDEVFEKYELEDNGVIRIRFTVIPELKRISLLVTPRREGNDLVWKCDVEGEISRATLPAHCRDGPQSTR